MLIQRKEYLNHLIAFRDKKLIKVITGVRRCGKSTLMELYQEYLKKQGVKESQIISINFEDYDFYELRDEEKLYEYLKNKIIYNEKNYIFLDEIQHVKDFARAVDSMYIKKEWIFI